MRSHPLWNPFKTESLESINAARAKPGVRKPALVEVDLTVADSVDEDAWLPDLELAGSELRVRGQLGSDEHRMLRGQQPITNLHVFSPGAREPQRHRMFRDWLRAHAEDRGRP